MVNKKKIFLLFIYSFILTTITPQKFFDYFTYKKESKIKLKGIESYHYYSGIIDCFFKGSNDYKISRVFLFLDDTPFCIAKKVNAERFKIPFKFDTTKFSNGFHRLKMFAIDASINKNKTSNQIGFYIDNMPLHAKISKNELTYLQGQTIHLRINSNKRLSNIKVNFLNTNYECLPEKGKLNIYETFIPIECEQNCGNYSLSVEVQDFINNKVLLKDNIIIKRYNFPKQKGVVVSKNDFIKKKSNKKNSNKREMLLEHALKKSSKQKLWNGAFGLPIKIRRVTTKFGEIRKAGAKKFNSKFRNYIHKGVDIVNTPRCSIYASQSGKIVLKGWYNGSGNTIVIDHGFGIFTFYYHLENFANINVGDNVKKGQFIGRVGTTGKSTGYHLHWELRVNNIAVDPFQWTKKSFWI